MTQGLRVLSPGLFTTLQDIGRVGYQHLGVPAGGALDPVALQAANALVNNAPDTAALEIFYRGPTLEVVADEVRIALCGASALLERLGDANAAGGEKIESMRSLTLRRGEVIRIGALSGGAIAYLAVEGGFAVEPMLGSLSTDIRSQLGGIDARALSTGDILPLRSGKVSDTTEYSYRSLTLDPPRRLRILPGPQRDFFSDEEFAAFVNGLYTVGQNSNRMGMRLNGRPIAHRRGANIVSDAVAPGSIQIPGDGQPIILLADRQTTGGYPKIANVISADIPALGRVPAGAQIGFELVTMQAAIDARRQLISDLAALPQLRVPVRSNVADVATRLHECNLISGVIDAAA